MKMNDPHHVDLPRLRLREVVIKPSTRPEKRRLRCRVGSGEAAMQSVLEQIAAKSGGKIKTGINPGEGAFYGPKFEYVLRDAIGRDWQCGTIQVDFFLPERFGAFYIDADGEKKTPVMIHRAMFGSMERFAGILPENTAGHLPLWLAPGRSRCARSCRMRTATRRRCWPP
jgi:threonyl-tRNA synthetase